MGLLDGGLQQMFGAAFAPQLLDGRHYKSVETRDTKGNVTSAVTKVQSFKGYRQSMSKAMREAGYAPDTGVLLVLQVFEGRQLVRPNRNETALLDGTTWVVGDLIDEDAAHVAWVFAVTPQ
jgi:hypothetical protein